MPALSQASNNGVVVALSGGVGGAKLALGLARTLKPGQLTVIANTGDDFHHLGLAISPDIDTLLYTLSGFADPVKGWGRRDETWTFMAALAQLGGPDWFQLGDGDLALHIERTHALASGASLLEITERFRQRLGIGSRIIPMSEMPVRTQLRTDAGWLDFQDYFVARRCEPRVHAVRYSGADSAEPSAEALRALCDRALRAVVICPSNPMLSIEPMLAMPKLREALIRCRAPIVAVSPIIGGEAIKGPTAKMLRELGGESSAGVVAQRYAELIDVFVADKADVDAAMPADLRCVHAQTLMRTLEDRDHLARTVLQAADDCRFT